MARLIDISGNNYGRLTVLSLFEVVKREKGKSYTVWTAKCSCGSIKNFKKSNLISGGTKSCGCIPKPIRKKPENVGFNALYAGYKHRTAKKGLEFSLSSEQFKELISGNCHYCNNPPDTKKVRKVRFLANGIDRVNSNVGYVFSNSVSCCKICNIMKNTLTKEQFIAHIKAINNNIGAICL